MAEWRCRKLKLFLKIQLQKRNFQFPCYSSNMLTIILFIRFYFAKNLLTGLDQWFHNRNLIFINFPENLNLMVSGVVLKLLLHACLIRSENHLVICWDSFGQKRKNANTNEFQANVSRMPIKCQAIDIKNWAIDIKFQLNTDQRSREENANENAVKWF